MKALILISWQLIAPSEILAKSTISKPFEGYKPVVSVVQGWCPIACEPDHHSRGYIGELTVEAFRAVGIEIDYQTMVFDEGIAGLKRGTVDATVGTFHDEAPFALFSERIVGAARFCFFSRKGDSWKYRGLKSLENRRFIYPKGYKYHEKIDYYLAKNPPGALAQEGEDFVDRSIKMLLAGRVDSLLKGEFISKFFDFEELKIVNSGCIDAVLKGYLAFSPVNMERARFLQKSFDRGVDIIRGNGRLARIAKKYDLNLGWWFLGLE